MLGPNGDVAGAEPPDSGSEEGFAAPYWRENENPVQPRDSAQLACSLQLERMSEMCSSRVTSRGLQGENLEPLTCLK